MPLAANNHLDELYTKQRMVDAEIGVLERRIENTSEDGPEPHRHYILEVERRALLEESTRLASTSRAFTST